MLSSISLCNAFWNFVINRPFPRPCMKSAEHNEINYRFVSRYLCYLLLQMKKGGACIIWRPLNNNYWYLVFIFKKYFAKAKHWNTFFFFFFFRGLNIDRTITNFLSIHCVTSDPSSISLVLVINTTSQEEVS